MKNLGKWMGFLLAQWEISMGQPQNKEHFSSIFPSFVYLSTKPMAQWSRFGGGQWVEHKAEF